MTASRAPEKPAARDYRADIDGLRGLAVLLVVAYHVGFGAAGAGFVGVDVFFVISGFLITSHLADEAERAGRVSLVSFWARRVQRLLPLATAVIISTIVVGMWVLNPLDWTDLLDQATAGTVYLANEHFAGEEASYFASDVAQSPLLHLWSLSVEEQFYVVWPLLVVVAQWIAARLGRRDVLLPVAVAAVAVSMMASWSATAAEEVGAYYSLLHRGWEIGLGGVLALAVRQRGEVRPSRRGGIQLIGLGAIVLGHELVARGLAFPMPGALLPVLGAALVVGAGIAPHSVARRLLTAPPLVAVGRWSYGWYLWHWPFLVLGASWLGATSLAGRSALALAALVLAAVTHGSIENRMRRSPRAPLPTLATGALLIGGCLLVVAGAHYVTSQFFSDPVMAMARAASVDYPDIPLVCTSVDADRIMAACVDGVDRPGRPILLVGDSHMAHWQPAVHAAAAEMDRPVVRSILGSCVSVGGGSIGPPGCDARHRGLLDLIDEVEPGLVVVAHTSAYDDLLDGSGRVAPDQVAAWRDGHAGLAGALRDRAVPLLVVLDTPRYGGDPNRCLVDRGEPEPCAMDAVVARRQHAAVNGAIEDGLSSAGHGSVLDPVRRMCPADECLLLVDGVVVQQDSHHVTSTYARAQAGWMEEALREALSGH